MPTPILRLASVLLTFLTACSAPPLRPTTPKPPVEVIATDSHPEMPAKPNVVTVPIETGLEPVPKRAPEPFSSPEPLPATPADDPNRPADAALSPYPAGDLPPAQSALPPIEPVIEPSLPPIDYQPPPDPAPVRTLSPRIGDKLFSQSAPPAVAALESDIEAQFRSRRYGDAAAQIDRALRIQPKNAELWHVLAEIRLRQNQPGLAEDLAKKSNSLAKSNPELVKSNWRIIADARRQQGNGAGAQDALEKAW